MFQEHLERPGNLRVLTQPAIVFTVGIAFVNHGAIRQLEDNDSGHLGFVSEQIGKDQVDVPWVDNRILIVLAGVQGCEVEQGGVAVLEIVRLDDENLVLPD